MQRALIDSIIKDINLTDSKTKTVPAMVALQLRAFKEDPPFNQSFDYRSAVGKLNYLGQIMPLLLPLPPPLFLHVLQPPRKPFLSQLWLLFS
jgi:hypothetical protein